jgi:DNA-binding XRE family transcriptional regulator
MSNSFGAHLRRIREESGISLELLAEKINYSKSYLSKIENDLKPPTADIAKRCDSVFGTAAVLSAMVKPPARHTPGKARAARCGSWCRTATVNRIFTGYLVGSCWPGPAWHSGSHSPVGPGQSSTGRPWLGCAVFDQYRQLDTTSSPSTVLEPVAAQINTLRALAVADHPEPIRRQLLLLASRVAEYAGWMSQEAGDEAAPLRWTWRAVEFADAGGDRHLASYALLREAELAMYHQDPLTTVELATRAQVDRTAGPRILGLAARCEAQGHALVGDPGAYHNALDRATAFLGEAASATPGVPILGSSSVDDEVALTHGWSLYDLGRTGRAARPQDRRDRECPPMPEAVKSNTPAN